MTEETRALLAEAKKNRYSTIKDSLTDDDVASVWENVSAFIEKQMALQKGVTIHGLGTFTFTQKKLDIGNNKFILIQRPIFMVSERFAQTHGLLHTKYHVPGQIPVVQLNYAALSFESPFDRDTVESCVKEIMGAIFRSIGAKRNVEIIFNSIGLLSIRDLKVKMKFYKEFINQMDGSGKLVDSLQNRPGTMDSVISQRSLSRPGTGSTVVLPKISSTHVNFAVGLAPVAEREENEKLLEPPVIDGLELPNVKETEPNDIPLLPSNPFEITDNMEVDVEDPTTSAVIDNIENIGDGPLANIPRDIIPGVNRLQMLDEFEPGLNLSARYLPEVENNYAKKSPIPMSRAGSRIAIPMAKATGIFLLDDLVPRVNIQTPNSSPSPLAKSVTTPIRDMTDSPLMKPKPPSSKLAPLYRSVSLDQLKPIDEKESVVSPPGSACGHPTAGQELCYLCHQRSRRNIPVSFTEERKKREEIEDRLLQQFQYMKDVEKTLKEQENTLAKRYDLQKMAAFNVGVSEAIVAKKKSRPTNFHRSYIFQKRPLTPPKFKKQEEYSRELHSQVDSKEQNRQKRKSDEDFLERLEQVQLAEDLAAQREQYLSGKAEQQDMYKKALESQLKFKPLPLPTHEPDSEVFGKNDMTNDKMADRRQVANDLFQEQQELVAQQKRENILKRLHAQREEEEILDRTRREMQEDCAARFQRRVHGRKRLESNWADAAQLKRSDKMDERLAAMSPGILLHAQCDKYSRCQRCKRMLRNCGESNIWSESRYIPGSRLMV